MKFFGLAFGPKLSIYAIVNETLVPLPEPPVERPITASVNEASMPREQQPYNIGYEHGYVAGRAQGRQDPSDADPLGTRYETKLYERGKEHGRGEAEKVTAQAIRDAFEEGKAWQRDREAAVPANADNSKVAIHLSSDGYFRFTFRGAEHRGYPSYEAAKQATDVLLQMEAEFPEMFKDPTPPPSDHKVPLDPNPMTASSGISITEQCAEAEARGYNRAVQDERANWERLTADEFCRKIASMAAFRGIPIAIGEKAHNVKEGFDDPYPLVEEGDITLTPTGYEFVFGDFLYSHHETYDEAAERLQSFRKVAKWKVTEIKKPDPDVVGKKKFDKAFDAMTKPVEG